MKKTIVYAIIGLFLAAMLSVALAVFMALTAPAAQAASASRHGFNVVTGTQSQKPPPAGKRRGLNSGCSNGGCDPITPP